MSNKKISINLPGKKESSKLRTILWYDSFFKKLCSFCCDKLEFKRVLEKYIEDQNGNKISEDDAVQEVIKYNRNSITKQYAKEILEKNTLIKQSYRIRAYPQTFPRKQKKQNIDILKWFDAYENYNESNAEIIYSDSENIIFDIPEKEVDNFCYNLDRVNVRFDILD